MHKEFHKWWSSNLDKEMDVVVYGHYGFSLLMFPTAGEDYLEYERCQLIDSISHFINSGKCKVFSINSINGESWLRKNLSIEQKAIRHQQYNKYVIEEVVPFIFNHCNGHVPIITTGASLGAFLAANIFFQRPDLFRGVIAMSGSYNLKYYARGYYDENVFRNSPEDYLSNWNDEKMLNEIRKGKIVIAAGRGDYEDPTASKRLSKVLSSKGIPHKLDLWGEDMPHDWPTWHKMLPYFLGTDF
ncbi:MAG: esterase [Chlorobiaceae bacterium]|nr:esterase [Chlorobiaceae bacterium]MBA4310055.1 esterase [Chlorobiaceae bacterium]